MSLKGLRKEAVERLTPENFLQGVEILSDIARKDRVVNFLLWAYGGALVATFGLFYLQGLGWIHLELPVLHWLGGATVGELAGLLVLTIKSVFTRP